MHVIFIIILNLKNVTWTGPCNTRSIRYYLSLHMCKTYLAVLIAVLYFIKPGTCQPVASTCLVSRN